MFEITQEIMILIAGLLILQVSLIVLAINDLRKQSFENKYIWLAVIVFISTIGPILYFLVAPRENTEIVFD